MTIKRWFLKRINKMSNKVTKLFNPKKIIDEKGLDISNSSRNVPKDSTICGEVSDKLPDIVNNNTPSSSAANESVRELRKLNANTNITSHHTSQSPYGNTALVMTRPTPPAKQLLHGRGPRNLGSSLKSTSQGAMTVGLNIGPVMV